MGKEKSRISTGNYPFRNPRAFFSLVPIFSALCLPQPSWAEPASEGARSKVEELRKEVLHHNRLYFGGMNTVISDSEYDLLLSELARLEAAFPRYASADSPTGRIGTPPEGRQRLLAHERPMLSLSSSGGPEEVIRLLRVAGSFEEKATLLLQPKVDGLPLELVYEGGRLFSAATRGDGHRGTEVTAVARRVPTIPSELLGGFPDRVVVRGEVYAEVDLFAEVNRERIRQGRDPYATPRHLAAAVLRSENPETSLSGALRLFPFEWVDGDLGSDLAALRTLAGWGFSVALEHSRAAGTLEEVEAGYREYLRLRQEQPFAMDGVVVKVDALALRRRLGEGSRAPYWAAAWKFPPATARTIVESIDWSTGRTGRRTPVALVKSVELGGVRVGRVSLHSAEEMARLGVAVGDEVVLALAGDVIPKVLDVVGKAPGDAGEAGISVKAPAIDACLQDSAECREQFLARLEHFASRGGLHIRGLGKKRLQKLVATGLVFDLPSLFELEAEDVASLSGFAGRRAEKLVKAIDQARRRPFSRLITALGIPGVGAVTAETLARRFGGLDALVAADQETLTSLDGIGENTASDIRAFFDSPGGREMLRRFRGLGLFVPLPG